ncbi:MAG TPA: GGDEF domain-containing protein [Rhizobacter sp.]|nr:GGDEF domain-containing protein [Rhizobacter sp.]
MSASSPATRPPVFGEEAALPVADRHSGRSYWQALTRAALAAALVHGAFSVVFLLLGAPLLVWANLVSIGMYAAAYRLLRAHRNVAATLLMWAELLLHAWAATAVVGWDSGFHYYILLMMPLVFVSPGRRLHRKVVLGLAVAGFYIGLDAFAHRHQPLSPISAVALDAVRYFNIAATLTLLAHLAHYYFGAVVRAESRLRDLASTDVLTGLANRRHMLQVAQHQLGRRRRDGTPLCLMLGDVDHFKAINDRLGHDVGDRALARVARAIKSATRESDIVGRWGGEEFLVVLPETELDAALRVAERVRVAVQQISVAAHVPALSVTLGVSSLRDGESLEDAIARADAAMYRGKTEGRNRCVVEAPLAASAQG